ncbi:unnamed protein product, partial [Mesorhabditis belari]|uniref:Uncharacterized protein n=1 Tax=Mesorhabditis belari TaxID=2138241 RepID=A0AAF3EY99_9BILA
MPRPFFGNYRTTSSTIPINSSILHSQRDSALQADALKAAVFKAASDKTSSSPQRFISVPISSPWHKTQNGAPTAAQGAHRVVSPQDICHLNPESMRGNFRFNIDVSSEAPLSITRR